MHILTSCPDKIARLLWERYFSKNENTAPGFVIKHFTVRSAPIVFDARDKYNLIWVEPTEVRYEVER
jgi:hypothetical protein